MDLWLKQMREDLLRTKQPPLSESPNAAPIDFEDMDINDKLRLGIKTRLMSMAPYIDKWPQAMALGLHP